MADAKLSELTAASSAAGTDVFYAVQGSNSTKMSVATLFANVATPVSFSDKIAITDSNTMTGVGEILTTTNITYISNVSNSGNFSIGAGIDGQVKIIIMTANVGGHVVTLQGPNIGGDISFSSVGSTATLLYTNGKWFFIGGTAAVTLT